METIMKQILEMLAGNAKPAIEREYERISRGAKQASASPLIAATQGGAK